MIVPARGGSKGLRRKNLRPLLGVPLVARVGELVRRLSFVDRAIVSTDDPTIAETARSAGLDAPFLRPDELAGDLVGDWKVLIHALAEAEKLDGVVYDIILMLQPTSPLRTEEHVRSTASKLVEGNFDAVWTVSATDARYHPLKQLVVDSSGNLDYFDERGRDVVARQQLAPTYHRNGAAYAISRSCLVDQGTIRGARTAAIVIHEPMVNIDTAADLEAAEILLRSRGSQ